MALFSPASPGWRAHHAPSDTRPCDRAGSAPRARRGVRRPCRTAQVGLGLSALAVAHRRGARGRVRVPTRQWSVARRAEEVDLDLPELELEPGVLSEAPEMTFMIDAWSPCCWSRNCVPTWCLHVFAAKVLGHPKSLHHWI